MEDPGPTASVPPQSLKGVPYGASKGTKKNPLAGAEERTDRQDKISGTTTAHTGAGEEMGA